MELKLVPKLQLGVVMTPQLKMAIKLLTLNHLELKDAVAQELVDNPVLEEMLDDPRAPNEARETELPPQQQVSQGPSEVTTPTTQQEPSIDWEAYADNYSYLPPSAGSGKDSGLDDLPGLDQTLTRGETLEEHLLWQMRMSDMNQLERDIGLRLLGEMNDSGFLDADAIQIPDPNWKKEEPKKRKYANQRKAEEEAAAAADELGDDDDDDDEPALLQDVPAKVVAAPLPKIDPVQLVADDLDVAIEWVEAVRRRMMRFDPVGCLARDLRECLLVQLETWGYDAECLVWTIVDLHMKEAEKHNYAAIARLCKCSHEDVGEAMRIIEQLEPRPSRNFIAQGSNPDSQYITPDVYVMKLQEDWIVSLNEDGLPKLKMSRFYVDKMREAQAQKAAGIRIADPSRSYIKEKMRTATWLIKSIHQRQRTIYRVCESILKYQRDWFDSAGPLKPLILKQVADDIEMHESTVSRVTSRKYMHTPRGVFELKYFFNSSINTGDGENIASEAVKDEIKRIVTGENPKKPLSDAAIVKILHERNIDIARRTVAKYRDVLGILPSNKRKQVF
ncbi:MAG: RNA polymerase factor sigma-54 [Deltaproteobacteria bacterium]|nr:RNA polymerase factor sigma-54 [Deltaproteobacteria bacterium]